VRVAVLGLGYVGCVSAAGFASRGHEVVGVDLNPTKVSLIQGGKTPVLEPGLAELVAETVADGRLRATVDGASAVVDADLSLICVGTPSSPNGSLSTEALERVVETIGSALPSARERHTVVVRSTTLPGTCDRLVVPLLERASGGTAGRDFGVSVNPEFLREGSSVADFNHPPKTLIGQLDAASGAAVESLYDGFPAPLFRVPLAVAEMAKYVDNAYHALKIDFANEIGAACQAFGLDSHEVMAVFSSDTKLNISTAYLTPGFAFGGSCLPKDLRALLYACRHHDVELPLLESIIPSNERHLQRAVDLLVRLGRRRVGIFGLAFKEGTDDLRESPMVELAERLLGKGFDLKIFDATVSLSNLVGTNREYIEGRIPHLAALLTDDAAEVVSHAEVCVIGAQTSEAIEAAAHANGRAVVDLIRLPDAAARRGEATYFGVAW
jgi:GDP-mannose 6-dehydrogenase